MATRDKDFFDKKESKYPKINDKNDYYNDVIRRARRGDIVAFGGFPYKHYAIYIGKGDVINVTSNGGWWNFFMKSKKTEIRKQPLWEAAWHRRARIDNHWDEHFPPGNPEEICQKAEWCIGKNNDYHILYKNCEHFVTWCRYNLPMSDQVKLVTRIIPHWLVNKNRYLEASQRRDRARAITLAGALPADDIESGHDEDDGDCCI